jgi:3-hydroxyacyl-[acyl-carrier-protein] dehydratase
MRITEHRVALAIPPDHPSFAGHFPGVPVAPGVLLQALVLSAAEAWLARPLALRHISQVKFHAPLVPGAQAVAHLKLEGERIRFRIEHDRNVMAEGSLTFGTHAAGNAA